MNRIFLAAVLCVIVTILPASAQTKSTKPRTTAVAAAVKPMPSGTTRVAVVNLGVVLGKYDRANAIKEEVQAELGKMREESKQILENINLWQSALQKGNFQDGTREKYEEKLINARRRFEDLNRQAQTKLGKSQQTQLVTLWSDVHEAVKTYSAAQGIDLVVAYGEPIDAKDVMGFLNIERKIRASDGGAVTPLFIGTGVDISEAVVDLLNTRYREGKEKTTDENDRE